MEHLERLRYGAVWRNLPLRTKAAIWLFLPAPVVALTLLGLGLGGFRRFEACLIPWMVAEVAMAVWVIEAVRGQIRSLRDAATSASQGHDWTQTPAHSWELNHLGLALEELARQARQRQRELEACRAEGQRLFLESPAPCLETNRDGIVVRVNLAAAAFLGRAPEDLCGKSSAEIFFPSDSAAAHERTLALLDGRQAQAAYEREFSREDGGPVLAGVDEILLTDCTGAVSGIRYTLVDRSARLEAAQTVAECERQLQAKEEERIAAVKAAAEAGEARTRFLSNISNDLRVPLNSIIGFAELMVDGKIDDTLSADQRECAGDILTSARHLSAVIDQLLDVARMEGGRPEVRRETVSLEAIVYNARYVLQVISGDRRGVRIEVELDPKVHQVPSDPLRLKRVVTSYLAYAVRNAPPNGRVVVRTAAEGTNAFRIEVEANRTTGEALVGEPARFPTGDAELSLALNLVEEQGGRAGLRHPQGRGWLIYAIFPTAPGMGVSEYEPRELPTPIEDISVDGRSLGSLLERLERFGAPADASHRVMVVSRHPATLTAALEGAGYQTVALSDLRGTLDVVAGQKFVSAVVVDLEDFGVDDYRFVLRALRSVGLSMPVFGYPCGELAPTGPQEDLPAAIRPRLQSIPAPGRKRTA